MNSESGLQYFITSIILSFFSHRKVLQTEKLFRKAQKTPGRLQRKVTTKNITKSDMVTCDCIFHVKHHQTDAFQ